MMREQHQKRGVTERLAALRKTPVAIAEGYHPVIGIPLPVHQGEQGPLFLADAVGAWVIDRGLGSIVLLPLWPLPSDQRIFHTLWPHLRLMDGLLLPADVQSLDWYAIWKESQAKHSPPQNIDLNAAWIFSQEIALAQLATYIGMPVLAIGEGAEKLNVALGGSVSSQVTKQRRAAISPDTWPRKVLHIKQQSRLIPWLADRGQGSRRENEVPWILPFPPRPRKGVEQLARGLGACAEDDDSHILAFERQDSVFGFGVLGRIDWCLDQWTNIRLFQVFLQSCREFAGVRLQNDAWERLQEDVCATLYERAQSHVVLSSPPMLFSQEKRQAPDQDERRTGTGPVKRFQRQPSVKEMRQMKKSARR